MIYEKPQKGNPHHLTIHQHLFPARSIERFCGPDGLVEVQFTTPQRKKKLKPDNPLFTTSRVWDERAEKGFMKKVEDQFQELAEEIVLGHILSIPTNKIKIVNEFYALWHQRSLYKIVEEIETGLIGVSSDNLTKDQQEIIEAKRGSCLNLNGTIPTRHVIGILIQREIDRYTEESKDYSWGIIRISEGEFLVPDVPPHNFIPISPHVLLVANHSDGTILRNKLIEINAAFIAYSQKYYFAHNLQTALKGVLGSKL